jgi:hypothetical protein
MSFITKTIYDAAGHTGNVYYITIVEQGTTYAWNFTVAAMQANPARTNMAFVLTEVGTSGRFPVDIPDALPGGHVYDIVIYKQAGASPAVTDAVQDSFVLPKGSIFGF